MPSPFPGMDPFLERQNYFSDLHASLTCYISEHLQLNLPEPYFTVLNQREWIDLPNDERRETFVDIRMRDTNEEERVVTTIEVLTHANKTFGESGRELYVRKQAELVHSARTHFVEIDLLRGGLHTTAVPRESILATGGPFDYHVVVHRFDDWERFFVYTLLLPQRLPVIPIPLLPGQFDVLLNLQEVFNRCYDAGPYRRRVRYELDRLVPPVPDEQREWVQQCLREKGLQAQ